jgi:hypothetical protein
VATVPVRPGYAPPPIYDAGLRFGASAGRWYAGQRYLSAGYAASDQYVPVQRPVSIVPEVPAPPVDLRLPYVSAVYLPDAIYAGETFTVSFAQSAPAAPACLLGPAPAVPAGEVQYLYEPKYDGSLFIMPWRVAAPPDGGTALTQLPQLDFTLCAAVPGTYHLQFWGADAPQNGGLPGAQAWKGAFLNYTYADNVTLWSVEFTVLPARLPSWETWNGTACTLPGAGGRAYNEHVWASGPSCLDTPSCFGVNGNHHPPAHLVRPVPLPRPRPKPQAPAHPPTAQPKQALPPAQAQVRVTPADLSLPLGSQ